MSGFVDFAELKARITMAEAIRLLGLTLKQSGSQWRGPCPTCKSGGERALVITEGKGFYCFALKKGGDQIALAAHINECSPKDAAQFLAGTVPVNRTVPGTVPESGRGQEGARILAPLTYLEHDHPAVDAVGFGTEFCVKHGIGYAGKGIMRGYVAIPFRDVDGTLLGYIGVQEAKLPADFTPNVVSLEKRRA